MKKRVLIVIGAVIVVAVGVAAYMRFRPTQAAAATATTSVPVSRRTLTSSVSSAGNIQSHQAASLAFAQSGTVKSVNVKVGDKVKKGDVLGELDAIDLQLALKSAEINLKNAEANFEKTSNPNTEADISNARAQLASAQAASDKLKAGPTAADLATAQAQLASARAAYDSAVASSSSDSALQSAAATLEKALLTLQQAQGAYDKISWRGDAGASGEAKTLQTATIDYNTAKAAYEALVATSKTDAAQKLASATASLKSAQANLDSVKNSVTAAQLASAEATLIQAKNNLETLLAGPDANTLAIAQNSVDSAQIALEQAKLKLQQAQVVAPFDGTVTAVNFKPGQTASGTAFSIADLDNLEVIVNMSEVDINKIKPGQNVEVTLDAMPEETFRGAVTLISPAGTQSSGVVNYPVTVSLTKAPAEVKTGMTANLTILVDEAQDVLTVPTRAIKTVNRQKYVTLLENGQEVQAPVVTGLSANSMTEIVKGLQEGDMVVVTSTSGTTTNNRQFGPGFGGMAPGGRVFIEGGGPPPGP